MMFIICFKEQDVTIVAAPRPGHHGLQLADRRATFARRRGQELRRRAPAGGSPK